MYEVDFSVILNSKDIILEGFLTTIKICLISMFFSFILGTIIVYLRTINDNKIIKNIIISFVEIIRNTPLLLQIFIVYKAFPQLGIMFSPIVSGILALSIYSGVYISEILRTGINLMNDNQKVTAFALNFSEIQTFFYIILPQALKNTISPLGSQFINLIKNSSLLSFISVSEIFYISYQKIADDFRIIEYFTLALILYVILTGIVVIITNIIQIIVKLKYKEAYI